MLAQMYNLNPKSVATENSCIRATSVRIEDDRIEVYAILLFQEDIEALIAKLQAVKELRPRATDEAKKDDEDANNPIFKLGQELWS